MTDHRNFVYLVALLLSMPGQVRAVAPGVSLLGLDGGGAGPAGPAPAAAAPRRPAVVDAAWRPAAEATMRELIADETRQRAHMWDAFRAVVAPTDGGAALFETWYTKEELKAAEATTPTSDVAAAGVALDAEALFNGAAYRHVRARDIYRLSTIERLMQGGKAVQVPALPRDSIMVKPLWELVPDSDPGREAQLATHYWCHTSEGYQILTSLHVVTHELDTWAWSTFWWVDNPRTNALSSGRPDAELRRMVHRTGTGGSRKDEVGVFTNYVMKTALAYFEPGTRQPRYCANPNIEIPSRGGLRSNCISCHQAAVFPRPDRWIHRVGRLEPTDPVLVGHVQTDFIWFLTTPTNVP